MPQAKYRLHASKVDRIAIVDRPCVPDAQIVVFKRRVEEGQSTEERLTGMINRCMELNTQHDLHIEDIPLMKSWDVEKMEKYLLQLETKCAKVVSMNKQSESQMFRDFVCSGCSVAVSNLESAFFYGLYTAEPDFDKEVYWKQIFSDFESIIDVISKITIASKGVGEAEVSEYKPTPEEVLGNFKSQLLSIAIDGSFNFFGNVLGSVLLGYGNVDKPQLVKGLIDSFREYVLSLAREIEKRQKADGVVIDKVGRKIAGSRLERIRKAVEVLSQIVKEVEVMPNEKREEEDMNIEEILKKLTSLEDLVTSLATTVASYGEVLKVKGLLVSAEDQAKLDAEIAEKARLELEKSEAEKLEVEKKRKEEEVLEKAKVAEALEKKEKEAEARLVKIEKSIGTIASALEKKLGVKTSLEVVSEKTQDTGSDPFGDALKGR